MFNFPLNYSRGLRRSQCNNHVCAGIKTTPLHFRRRPPERWRDKLRRQRQWQRLSSFGHVSEVHSKDELFSFQLPVTINVSQGPKANVYVHSL